MLRKMEIKEEYGQKPMKATRSEETADKDVINNFKELNLKDIHVEIRSNKDALII